MNWSKEVTPCRKIRIRIGKKEAIISREDFYSMAWMFGGEKQHERMVSVKKTEMVPITRMLTIKAVKSLKKGETIAAPYTYLIPKNLRDRLVKEKPSKYKIPKDKLSTPDIDTIVREDVEVYNEKDISRNLPSSQEVKEGVTKHGRRKQSTRTTKPRSGKVNTSRGNTR